MRSLGFALIFLPIVFIATTPTVIAQQPPHIAYVYPAGGQRGSTFQTVIGGQRFTGVPEIFVSGDGVQGKSIELKKPLTQKEVGELRDKLQELQKKPKDAETDKEMAIIRRILSAFQKMPGPALAERVVLEIEIDSKAEPGLRELRLKTDGGLSNPMVFQVGTAEEFSKQDAQTAAETVPIVRPNVPKRPKSSAAEPEMDISLPAVVNGQIMPGQVDRYRFNAKKGQQLVAVAAARELIPYLADAVPGWFQASLAITDAKGNELSDAYHFRFQPDPILRFKIPADGQYFLEIKDLLYRGREDFVYRITLGELPYITSIFPLGGPQDKPTDVELTGWNLPTKKIVADPAEQSDGLIPISVRRGKFLSNTVPFAVDTLPEYTNDSKNKSDAPQKVELPIVINGRIDRPNESDAFSFMGKAGEKIVAEVNARKLDSPLDSILKLSDEGGRLLATNDDYGDKGAGLDTHHADSLIEFQLPKDGIYTLSLSDAQYQGGAEYGYRLRISKPRPDYALRMVPSSLNLKAGASVPFTVYALRKDGFSGEIRLSLLDAPKGFSLKEAKVPANQDRVQVTLTAPPTPLEQPIILKMEGRADIQGKELIRSVIPAEDMMQAFIYRHLVPAQNLMVAVSSRGRPRPLLQFVEKQPLEIQLGKNYTVKFSFTRKPNDDRIKMSLLNPPEGISIKETTQAKDAVMILLNSDSQKMKVGTQGNLIFEVFAETTRKTGDGKPDVKKNVSLGVLPAISYKIVE